MWCLSHHFEAGGACQAFASSLQKSQWTQGPGVLSSTKTRVHQNPRSSNKVLTIASGICQQSLLLLAVGKRRHGQAWICSQAQRLSGQAPSSATASLSCAHPSRPRRLQPGKNKEQVCNSAAYKTINIVQGCGATIITHRSET